jgi:2-dehydropantoate 2-reductase
MRFHVLGVGSIGTLIAHHLRRARPATDQLSLIVRKDSPAHIPYRAPNNLVVEFNGVRSQVNGGFQTEYAESAKDAAFKLLGEARKQWKSQDEEKATELYKEKKQLERLPNGGPIDSLIVATKATRTLQALRQCRERISSNSTIVLLQNGMGIYDSVVENLFPYPEDRPNFIIASTTHGAWKKRDIETAHHVVHAGFGDLCFAIMPDSRTEGRDFEKSFWQAPADTPAHQRSLSLGDIDADTSSSQDPKYVSLRKTVEALLSMDLNTKWQPMTQLQIRLRQKLTINSSINPLTALIGCRNGDLLGSSHSRDLIRAICHEASAIFRQVTDQSHDSGEWLFGGGNAAAGGMHALSAGVLESETYQVIKKTSANYSSMVVDMERGSILEIDYMNGFLSRMGQTYRVPTPTIDALRHAVLIKAALRRNIHLV